MRCTLHGARLVDASGDLPSGDLSFDGASITAAGVSLNTPDEAIDAADMIVMPGFIDVHTHGGGGCNLHTADANEIRAYARWVPATGVTSFLAAVVDALEHPDSGAELLGIHLEGPYINERRRGAHLPAWLRAPDADETEHVLALTHGHLRILTLAPELPGASAMIRRLVDAGVTVSLGHSDATYEQALEAIQLGVTHITHCCNAMRPLLHRDPGPLSALSESPAVFGEVIAD